MKCSLFGLLYMCLKSEGKKRNKTDGFTVLCVSILFKFEISCLRESVIFKI